MKMLFEAHIRCKNTNCKMYDERQNFRFKNMSDFYDNPQQRKCRSCGSIDVLYTSATRVYLGMTVSEAIQALSNLNQDAILTLDIEFPTCEDGTCFDDITNYVYEIFQVDSRDEVKILYSPNKD